MKKFNYLLTVSICFLACTFLAGCFPDDPDGTFELDTVFSLEHQKTKSNNAEGISITFDGIVSDSRCPVEVVCVWAGNAEVQLTFSNATEKKKFVLNTGLEPSEIIALGYRIKLEGLAPPASTENPPAQKDYIASLIIAKSDDRCMDNSSCPEGSYCAKEPGDCTGTGTCAVMPEACILIWAPVCGCDGATYGNSCNAAGAGVNIDYIGECKSSACDDGTTVTCKMMTPVCTEYEILAVQNNCWVCVNPATCKPWGEPGCSYNPDCTGPACDTAQCPEGQKCNPCGTSSCPFCEDCVPACVSN